MALPSGYTKLDYIESSGTQHIDTGFIPNQDSAVHIVCQPTVASDWQGIFGARSATNVGEFGVDIPAGTTLRSVYGTNSVTTTVSTVATKLDIYKNKNVCTINGAVLTNSTQTFSSGYPIWIFDKNTAGAKWNPCSMKLYSCKVYDNGTLVRDFIPCKNASGTLGLWDNVNSVFYANAGTGVFIAGPEVPISGSGGGGKHKTLIAGTSYGIKSGRTLIGGTGYDIKKGRTLIGGTGYDIKFGTSVGEIAVGSSVYMNVGQTTEGELIGYERCEFIVVHQGNPNPALYDASCDGTWLLMKDIYTTMSMDYSSKGYKNSNVHSYLNGEFLGLLEMNVQNAIKQVKIPYRDGDGRAAIKTGANGLLAKIFLLSASELGENYFGEDGATLDYFKDAQTNVSKLEAYYNGKLSGWQLRSTTYSATYKSNWTAHVNVNRYGEVSIIGSVYGGEEVRPALIVPQNDVIIDDNFNIIAA